MISNIYATLTVSIMDSTTAARVFMGDSLGFHIIFVLYGLGLPILVSWFEWMGIRQNNPKYIELAKKWSKVMSILVVTGVISGTIIALQMSLVWPGIMQFGGKVIGLPFMFETYAFLVEATFLALYMTTWNSKRISKKMHWVFGVMVGVGGATTAFFITSVNAWMNNPVGFEVNDGKLVNINVWKPLFSNTSLIEFFHSLPGYFLACTLTVAGLYAWPMLKASRIDRSSPRFALNRLVVGKLVRFSLILLLLTGLMGHVSAVYLAKHEPLKLAAIESHAKTRSHAPTVLGGIPNENGELSGPRLTIPSALSILSGNSPNTVVKGLEDFPKQNWPSLIVHTLFDIKMLLVGFMAVIIVVYVWAVRYNKYLRDNKLMLSGILLSGFVGVVVIELGWMLTEIGRQPWAVRGYLLTKDAVTKTHDVTNFGYLFPLSYLCLFAITIIALRVLLKRESGGK